MLSIIKTVIHDEQGDLVQNIIWIYGGILTAVPVLSVLYGTIKTKIQGDDQAISRYPP